MGKIKTGNNPTHKLKGPTPATFDFYLTWVRTTSSRTGMTYNTTVKDALYSNILSNYTANEATVSVNFPGVSSSIVYSSLDPTIATVDQSGNVTYITDGNVRINAKCGTLTKQVTIPVFMSAFTLTTTFTGFVTGSLARHMTDYVISKIRGQSANAVANTKLFSTENHSTQTYVWNTSHWAYGVNMTSIAIDHGGSLQTSGVLITPRHLMYANHFGIGTPLRFVKQDGTVVTPTIINTMQVGTTDMKIAVFSADIGPGIAFAKVLPANTINQLPTMSYTTSIPIMGCLGGGNPGLSPIYPGGHNDKLGRVTNLYRHSFRDSYYFENTTLSAADPDLNAFFIDDAVGGDSGNPNFAIINGELALVTNLFTGAWGPAVSDFIADVNAVILALGNDGGYTLTPIDTSGFPSY